MTGRLKTNAQQGTKSYPSMHNVFPPVESFIFFSLIASRVALVTEKNGILIGYLKTNAQQGTKSYPSTHNVFPPVEFQMLARVYQPVEI